MARKKSPTAPPDAPPGAGDPAGPADPPDKQVRVRGRLHACLSELAEDRCTSVGELANVAIREYLVRAGRWSDDAPGGPAWSAQLLETILSLLREQGRWPPEAGE